MWLTYASDYSATLFSYFLVSLHGPTPIYCRHIRFHLWESALFPSPLSCMVSVSPGWQGVSRHRAVQCPCWQKGFTGEAPSSRGAEPLGGQCLLPFLDWCTWPLNWGKPQDVLFITLLCSRIVNFQMQGKYFCSGQYNAKCKRGLVWLKKSISELIQIINTPWSFIIYNFCCEQSIEILVWSLDWQSTKQCLSF